MKREYHYFLGKEMIETLAPLAGIKPDDVGNVRCITVRAHFQEPAIFTVEYLVEHDDTPETVTP